MTYKTIGRSIINYGAPVWSTNASTTSFHKQQIAQNDALKISTGSHLMSSIDHLHVQDHSELLFARPICMTKCLQPMNVYNNITTRGAPSRRMKHTLYTRHRATVEPLRTDGNLHSIYITVVNKSIANRGRIEYLMIFPRQSAKTKGTSTTLSQLRSGHCKTLGTVHKRIGKDATDMLPRLWSKLSRRPPSSMCSLAVSALDSPAVDWSSNPGSGKHRISENLKLYTTSPVVKC